ncbi:MAG: SAM-dependent methyltransferase [Anaerolineae bacterium]
MSDETLPNDLLGATAHWTAAVRALESARADHLFLDPYAAALSGEEGAAWMAQRAAASVLPMVVRTRFFDDWLQHIAQQEGIRQIVLLAAGLDTRAFRLDWPAETCITELDQLAVLESKEQALRSAGAQPTCARQTIAANLGVDWQERLLASGFDSQKPSGWLLEGFLFYLSNESLARILDAATRLAAPGSMLGFDIVNSATFTSPLTKPWIEMQARSGAPWLGMMDDPVEFLAPRDWQAVLTQPGEPEANYGRWPYPVIPNARRDMPHHWLVTAVKR